jgi:hypothetical protein
MKQNKDAGQGERRMKDLKGKKLSVTQQEAVKGGITDGTSNTIMIAEVKLPAVQVRPAANKAVSP